MSIFTAEPASLASRYDIPSDVARVVEATRHLCDYRTGLAEALEAVAERAVVSMPDEGVRQIEPLLRILGPESAEDYARRLYVAACQVVGHWDPDHDTDRAHRVLQQLCADAAHAVSDEHHKDSRCCRDITEGAGR